MMDIVSVGMAIVNTKDGYEGWIRRMDMVFSDSYHLENRSLFPSWGMRR